jgi:peptidoglycan lytic transglycosylase
VSVPAATYSSRRQAELRKAARRRVAARRRRALFAVIVIVAAIVATVLALPLFQKAVTEFNLPLQHEDVIRQQAADKHLDPALIAAVIYTETKFDPRPSSAGAQGLMQILPQTAEFLARKSGATSFTTTDLATPQVNIAYGSYYLRYLLNEYHGRIVPALAAYNGGEANVNHWVAAAHAHGHPLRISDIPFPETRAYVHRVLGKQREYRRTYASALGYS